jgi:predicted secreted protein
MRGLAFIAVTLLGCATAAAGDHATFAIVGYSEDNRYFAYEEFSIGDESLSPYVAVGLLDLYSGSLVSGSPFEAGTGGEHDRTLTEVRIEAIEEAAHALSSANIATPGHYLALVGDGERDEATSLTFSLRVGAGLMDLGEDIELRLDQAATGADRCTADDFGDAVGFSLVIRIGNDERTLAQRTGTENPDLCMRAYRLYGVVQPYNGGDIDTLVAIVSAYSIGFEGFDRRFMVIPIGPRQPDN